MLRISRICTDRSGSDGFALRSELVSLRYTAWLVGLGHFQGSKLQRGVEVTLGKVNSIPDIESLHQLGSRFFPSDRFKQPFNMRGDMLGNMRCILLGGFGGRESKKPVDSPRVFSIRGLSQGPGD